MHKIFIIDKSGLLIRDRTDHNKKITQLHEEQELSPDDIISVQCMQSHINLIILLFMNRLI
jgi:hypothetical protein